MNASINPPEKNPSVDQGYPQHLMLLPRNRYQSVTFRVIKCRRESTEIKHFNMLKKTTNVFHFSYSFRRLCYVILWRIVEFTITQEGILVLKSKASGNDLHVTFSILIVERDKVRHQLL